MRMVWYYKILLVNLINIGVLMGMCLGGDPFVRFDLEFTYKTPFPTWCPSAVITINDRFPAKPSNVTTNNNVVVNVKNLLDEELFITWPGIQMRRVSYADGVRGTNCPILPNWNWTYQFQAKDQVGSFFFYPSLNLQRAAGGFGSLLVINPKKVLLPFNTPDGEIVITIGDWYIRNHTALRSDLDAGKELGILDGVLMNGKGPYKYNNSVPDGINYETVNVDPGKTYRVRVHNVGVSTCLNFRIQNHNLLLAETEGYYASQQNYSSLDIHVGQSYSFLITMDQNATSDYYIVASARFVNETVWQRVTGVAILHYSNSKGKANGPLPNPPNDDSDKYFVINQALSIRQNLTASNARQNPQGSFHYGNINVTDVYILRSLPPTIVDGKLRSSFNGISFVNPDTPIRLADKFNMKDVYKLDFPNTPLMGPLRIEKSIINGTYKGFIEIILQNNDTVPQSFHMDGYSFFVVRMGYGEWTEANRNSYNKWDAILWCTSQVFPGRWTAIMVSLDNAGVWNLRVENLDRLYLGQETYMRIINPEEDNTTEFAAPDNVLYCGALGHLQTPETASSGSTVSTYWNLYLALLTLLYAAIHNLF